MLDHHHHNPVLENFHDPPNAPSVLQQAAPPLLYALHHGGYARSSHSLVQECPWHLEPLEYMSWLLSAFSAQKRQLDL